MNAAALVKQKLGKSIFSQADLKALDPSDWRNLVWAGLQRHQKGITIEDVGSVMNLSNWQACVGKCMEAFTVGLPKVVPDPTTEPETEPVPAQA